MKISREEVIHVADLSRLDVDKELIDKFAEQLGTILEYVDTLKSVDTKGVTPTSHAISMTNAFRDDMSGADVHLLATIEPDAAAIVAEAERRGLICQVGVVLRYAEVAVGNLVERRRDDGTQQAISFDYGSIKNGEDLETNILLQSGDVVVVP